MNLNEALEQQNVSAIIEHLSSNGYKRQKEPFKSFLHYIYNKHIPSFLNTNGSDTSLYTLKGTKICDGYNRIVIGDYGAYVEFSKEQSNMKKFRVPQSQEFRFKAPYKDNVKFLWYTIFDNSNVKIYYQLRTVSYADYIPNMGYVSVMEVLDAPIV